MKINSIQNINFNNKTDFKKRSFNPAPNSKSSNAVNIIYPKNYYLNHISFTNRIKNFKSTEEANEYFLERYGAKADFETVEQAQTLDYAIKDFLSKTEIKRKKFLKDVEIASLERQDDSCLKIAAQIQKSYNFDDEKMVLAKEYEARGKFDEFIKKFNPSVINCNILRLGLMLNSNYDWSLENIKKSEPKIQNSLAVLLHLKNSPFDYAVKNQTAPNDDEIKIMAEITGKPNKNDFVEKYILKRLKGETVSAEATKLYREFGGPNIFSDWAEYDFAGVRFSSLKEAKEYFMNEYGIKADFKNLEQAYVAKCAIDDFIRLDTIKDKRFLEGINIGIKDKMHGNTQDARAEVALDGYEFVYNDDMNELYEKYKRENRTSDFFVENKPDKINVKKITVFMKSDFGWEAKPKGKSFMADISRSSIHHEIGHILHLKNDPFVYISGLQDMKPAESEYKIMKKVSDYATKSKLEFVAEYISNRMAGKTFDSDVVELYKKLGGPNIFKDW